jgi:ankyrin repeat protein
MMYLLLKHGAKVDERDGVGRTAVHSAVHSAASNAKFTNVKVLLSLGADIDTRDKENSTPLLSLAARAANVPNEDLTTIAWMLLDRNADVNAKNVDDESAVRLAARHMDFQLVKALSLNGARTDSAGG